MTIRTIEAGGLRKPIMGKTEDSKWGPNAKMLYIWDGKVGFAIYSPSNTDEFESDYKINDGEYHSIGLRFANDKFSIYIDG
jgi:hypothetical protein